MKYLFAITFISFACVNILHAQNFGNRQVMGELSYAPLNEASGLAASRKNNDVLWSHNDSGNNEIYALDTSGQHLGVYMLDGISFRDVEDIAVGPGPSAGEYYIYLGDIGDNAGSYSEKYIYRFLEPDVIGSGDATISGVETIAFRYPEPNNYDAETLLVDPLTNDLYIVTKRKSENSGGEDLVFRAPYPQSTTEITELTQVAALTIPAAVNPMNNIWYGATGGDISAYGYEILVRTYDAIYYWAKGAGDNIWDAFENPAISCPYDRFNNPPELQGEAICWKADARGYYTTSEEPNSPFPPFDPIPAYLYFYERTDDPTVPVELVFFSADLVGEKIMLKWRTQTETHNLGFKVQRAYKSDWRTIGFVRGNGTTTQPQDYQFSDSLFKLDKDATLLRYRLKQIDADGSYQYSDTVEIKTDTSLHFKLDQNYPNPFNLSTAIPFVLPEKRKVKLSLFSLNGNFIREIRHQEYNSGYNVINMDASDLTTGLYIYQFEANDWTDIKKMLVIK